MFMRGVAAHGLHVRPPTEPSRVWLNRFYRVDDQTNWETECFVESGRVGTYCVPAEDSPIWTTESR